MSICGQCSALFKKCKRGWRGQPQVRNSSVPGGIRHSSACKAADFAIPAMQSWKAPAPATPLYSGEWKCRFTERWGCGIPSCNAVSTELSPGSWAESNRKSRRYRLPEGWAVSWHHVFAFVVSCSSSSCCKRQTRWPFGFIWCEICMKKKLKHHNACCRSTLSRIRYFPPCPGRKNRLL